MKTLRKIHGPYLFVLIAMGGLVASSLGVLTNTAGIFFSPIAQELAGGNITGVNLTLTISNLVFAAAGMVSARVVGASNFKRYLILCTLCFAGSTAGMALCHHLPELYALSAVRGFAAGMIGTVLATTVVGYWFRSDAGFINSLILGCSGLAGALLNPALEAVIRISGWRTAYLVSAGMIVLLNLPAMALPISFNPQKMGLEALQADPSPGSAQKTGAGQGADPGKVSTKLLIIAMIMGAFASFVTAMPQLFKPLAISYGLESTGVAMMSVVLIANTGGKFLFGAMTDRLGVKKTIITYGFFVSIGILLLMSIRSSVPMLVSAALIGLSYSVPTVGAVMICRSLFHADHYNRIYPKVNLSITIANALGYPVLGVIYDRTGSYQGALILVLVLTLGTMAAVMAAYKNKGADSLT